MTLEETKAAAYDAIAQINNWQAKLNNLNQQIADFKPDAPVSQQREFIVQNHSTLNAPSSKIRNRLLRISADSPDLLAVIKEEGKV